MLGRWKWVGALILMGCLLLRPADAVMAATDAMRLWATSFAPALFPFFVISPTLTCTESRAVFARALGGFSRRALGIDGGAMGAVMVGCVAGSPAGCAALASVPGLRAGETARAAVLASGVSPAFLITYVGHGILGDARLGQTILIAQYISLFLTGWLMRDAGHDADAAHVPSHSERAPRPVADACANVFNVCGYMVFFGVVAGMLSGMIGRTNVYPFVSPLFEITTGMHALSRLAPSWWRLPLMSSMYALGGLSIGMQNRARLPGMPLKAYVLGKCWQAALAFPITVCLQRAPIGNAPSPEWYIAAGILLVPVVFVCRRAWKVNV